ncbi:uncharacterized protein CPUR_00378 [Claviceps purpurea 20.1]|uniref:Gem-associated protein 5 TPR domain-containing protein n=1 Tax=Claviceps purpurea (strain 20.1) TaxID=1111077 RepID=M1W939_CLAP2|nr:uncharacterized protein CPUR_00378 [Claviceps purpurea 20.1]
MSTSSRNHTTRSSGRSSTARGERVQDVTSMPPVQDLKLLEPCAATASMFLYAQGTSIVCCHHDTLAIERRFTAHSHDIQLLAVDNQSETGGGRLVVSYDASQTAIVWDLMTGDEIARFTSFQMLTVAAWMSNGNVAFGNTQGNIILFEPTTSQHISSRTFDQIAVTALAPSADCRTFAIGFQNGSLLIATLQPRFIVLHNLTTSRAPSPIVTLAWHASSTRQKSDMLAVQTHDGDLRVWSVAKSYNTDDPAKVVRTLGRKEESAGPNWMGWSKNGRIIQFSDLETLSWDVRTKHVTCDSIPTLEHVRGMAVYGPGATLFTVGRAGTVQQFDLNSPSIIVANVQHPTSLLPPSPPNSIEEPGTTTPARSIPAVLTSESESSSVPFEVGVSESEEDGVPPFAHFPRRPHLEASVGEASRGSASPVSGQRDMPSFAISSAGSRTPGIPSGSVRSRDMTENTHISAGSSLRSSAIGCKDLDSQCLGYTMPSTSAASMAPSHCRRGPSRLRHQVPRSPDDNTVVVNDLLMFTRTRLSDLSYQNPMNMNANKPCLTNDDLREQMLSTIFGWHQPIEDLVRDEIARHPARSTSRILLSKWLGDMEADFMVGSSDNMTSSDWMILALSGISGQQPQQKLVRAYVQRLLETGDIHVAVTMMLGMGDQHDAIEIYVSHKRYMEALILACLVFPGVWERQAAIIRRWGEWAVQNGQQSLAIRCFACTNQESTEPWRSPSAVQLNFQRTISDSSNMPDVLSPPLSPPRAQRGPQRRIAKTSALKLITSFDDKTQDCKFYLPGGDGQTPIAAGVTPIAESAISPAGNEATTAFLFPSSRSRFNTPTSARPSGTSYSRGRLPSIGETLPDLNRDALEATEKAGQASKQNRVGGHSCTSSADQGNLAAGISFQRAATASPMTKRNDVQTRMQETRPNQRNGSRDRIPRGVDLQISTLEQRSLADKASPEPSGASSSSTRYHWPSRRVGSGSVAGSMASTSSADRNMQASQKQCEEYIHGVEAAHSTYSREPSRGRNGGGRETTMSREASEERGRSSTRECGRFKRSPTSPLPMSPEDLANLSTPQYVNIGEPMDAWESSAQNVQPGDRASSRCGQRRSPDGQSSHPLALDVRGRSIGREEVHCHQQRRSPSAASPPSAYSALHYHGSEDEEAKVEQRSFGANDHRSGSCGIGGAVDSSFGIQRQRSESRGREAAEALDTLPPMNQDHHRHHVRATSTDHAGDLRQMKDRQRRREQAARDLEERRKSLAMRSQVPAIPHPNECQNPATRVGIEMQDPKRRADLPPRCATEPPRGMNGRKGPALGLPATPMVMKLMMGFGNSTKVGMEAPEESPISPYGGQAETLSHNSPNEEGAAGELMLLPSTVYQPPPRKLGIARSMSAPVPDEPHRVRYGRKASTSDDAMKQPRRGQFQDVPPSPPSPPAPATPPRLQELAHLLVPPPPPVAPLPQIQRRRPGNALQSGMIEVVMDANGNAPVAAAPNDGLVPVLATPTPPRGRNRGRSVGEGSFAGQVPRAGHHTRSASHHMRSASWSRKDPGSSIDAAYHQRTLRSPDAGAPRPVFYPDVFRSPIEHAGKHLPTGLDRGEMI